jgi:hypothetical protein
MKNTAIAILIFGTLSFLANAATFTLTNNQTGTSYTCGGGNGGNDDPSCVKQIRKLCDDETTNTDDQCFQMSVQACREGASAPCVNSVYNECDNETTMTHEECFVQSIHACNGKPDAINKLMSAAKRKK